MASQFPTRPCFCQLYGFSGTYPSGCTCCTGKLHLLPSNSSTLTSTPSRYTVVKVRQCVQVLAGNCYFYFFNWNSWGVVQLGPLGTAATNRPTVPAPGDYNGKIGGMMIGRGNRRTRRKFAPGPLCPPQTPHAARTRTRAVVVGSQRLTA
jgi:hypothetical protein